MSELPPKTLPAPIPPGKPEAPVPVLVARWMVLGCGATLAVIAVAFLFWMFVVVRGISQ